MDSYRFLFDMALILLSTKVFGIITRKFDMPQVVGALLAGLVLGPSVLGIIHETTFMDQMAEIGVIVLMFTAGLETDISQLKKSGRAALIIALFGVLIPVAGGYAVSSFFHVNGDGILRNLFIGVILASTSVSITVETLKEMGKLSTRSGNAILGAALIDDIIGILALTAMTGAADTSVKLWVVALRVILFFGLSLLIGIFLHKWVEKWMMSYANDKRRFAVLSFVLCLLYAYAAERVFGVGSITGAFIAGLIIAKTARVTYVISRLEIVSYMFVAPVFFASIGIKVVIPQMTEALMLFMLLLLLTAVLGKIVGCGIGAKLCGYSRIDSLRVGLGMVARGEVALVVANQGIAAGLMKAELLGPIVILVVVTPIISPILLRMSYKTKKADYSDLVYSELVDQYQEAKDFDLASQTILNMHDELRGQGKTDQGEPHGEEGTKAG